MDDEPYLLDDEPLTEELEESLAQAEQTYAHTQAQATQPNRRDIQQADQLPNKKVRYSASEDQRDSVESGARLGNRPIGRGSENRSESFGVGKNAESLLEEDEESISNRNQIVYDEESKKYVNRAIQNHDENGVEGGGTTEIKSVPISNGNRTGNRVRPLPPPNDTLIRKDGKLAHPVPKKALNQSSNREGENGKQEGGFHSDVEDDAWWNSTDLDQEVEEAVKSSQQRSQIVPSIQDNNSHPINHSRKGINQNGQSRTGSPSLNHHPLQASSRNQQQQQQQQNDNSNSTNSNINKSINGNRALQQRSNSGSSVGRESGLRHVRGVTTEREEDEKDRELRQMKEEVEKLRVAQQEQLAILEKVKQSHYASAGEVIIVRSRHDKLQSELTALRQKEIAREKQFKEEMEKLKRENETERSNLRVQGAFERHVNDTQGGPSNFKRNTLWPGSNLASGAVPQSVRRGLPLSGSQSRNLEMNLRTPISKPGSGVNADSFYSRTGSGGRKRKAAGQDSNSSPPNEERRDGGAGLGSPSRGRGNSRIASPADKKRKKLNPPAPAFPGFENAFATSSNLKNLKEPSETKAKSSLDDVDQVREDRTDFDPATKDINPDIQEDLDPEVGEADPGQDEGVDHLVFDAAPPNRSQDQVPGPLLSSRSTWEDPHRWYLYAVTELQRRRSGFVAQILAHATSPHAPPRSLPGSRYLPKPPSFKIGAGRSTTSTAGLDQRIGFDPEASTLPRIVLETQKISNVSVPSFSGFSSSSTLCRILALQLPPSCPTVLNARLATCKSDLLNLLSKGSTSDGVERFKFLVVRAEAFVEEAKSLGSLSREKKEEQRKVKDDMFWETEEEICRGILELSEGFAEVSRILLGLLLRVGLVDAFNDVMSLVSSTATAEPSFASSLLLPDQDLPGLANLCYPTRNPAREMTMVDSTLALERSSNPSILKTPTDIRDILVESLRICCIVPLGVSIPETIGSEPPLNSEAWKDWEKWEKTKPWDVGEICREQLMKYWMDLLETFCWREGGGSPEDLKPIYPVLNSPGILFVLLDSKRSPRFLQRVLRLLTELSGYNTWRCILQNNPDDNLLPNLHPLARKSQIPLFEILARHLVDRVADTSPLEAHQLHTNIVVFLGQLVSRQPDALLMAADAEPLVGALIKCLSFDTDVIWNFDGRGIDKRETRLEETLSRIYLDVKLLHMFFVDPACPVSLTDRLDSFRMSRILNGARHLFVLSVGRAAFAPAPDWMTEGYGEEMSRKLESVAYPASELLNVVLSPEECDELYSLLATVEDEDESDKEEEEEDDEEQMMMARSAGLDGDQREALGSRPDGSSKENEDEDSSTEDEEMN